MILPSSLHRLCPSSSPSHGRRLWWRDLKMESWQHLSDSSTVCSIDRKRKSIDVDWRQGISTYVYRPLPLKSCFSKTTQPSFSPRSSSIKKLAVILHTQSLQASSTMNILISCQSWLFLAVFLQMKYVAIICLLTKIVTSRGQFFNSETLKWCHERHKEGSKPSELFAHLPAWAASFCRRFSYPLCLRTPEVSPPGIGWSCKLELDLEYFSTT